VPCRERDVSARLRLGQGKGEGDVVGSVEARREKPWSLVGLSEGLRRQWTSKDREEFIHRASRLIGQDERVSDRDR
jgi:hypothetical protein